MSHTAPFSTLIGLSSVARKKTGVDPERELLVRWQLGGPEPAQLAHVVRRLGLARDDERRPVEVQRRGPVRVLPVGIDLDGDEVEGLDLEPGLLAQLADDRGARILSLLEEAPGQIPLP